VPLAGAPRANRARTCAVGCRALFATHFHELARPSSAIGCATTKVVRGADGLPIFTFKVEKGVAEGSFGLHVAGLVRFLFFSAKV